MSTLAGSLGRSETGIARLASAAAPLSFESLRAEGLALVQASSGELWTDYNLHDPGVTLLEALCYALTEGVYDAQHPVEALLGGPKGGIVLARHALFPCAESLPSRPVTQEDYQRWILDQVPDLERLDLETAQGAGTPPGLWSLAPRTAPRRGRDPEGAAAKAALAYLSRRNLGEDLAAWPLPADTLECTLRLELSLSGSRDAAEVLADVILRCSDRVAGELPRRSFLEHLGDGLGAGVSLPDLMEGPPNQRGWIESDRLARGDGERLFFSDLARDLRAIDGVGEINALSLEARDLEPGAGFLALRGPNWVRSLHWPRCAADLSAITVFRSGAPVSVPTDALLNRLADLAATPGAPRTVHADADGDSPLALPEGRALPEYPYHPAQRHLPPVYQDLDGPALTGYLALFEQWMAHAEAQRRHLRDLFTLDPEPERSYWWQMLDDSHVAGMEALYREPLERTQREVFEALDPVAERRGRVLDFLLSLHGVSLGQERLRAFGCYFTPRAWDAHLFEQKRLLLEHVVAFTRDRMGAFDYTRPLLGAPDNTPAVLQRVSLELGFKHRLSRKLTGAFQDLGLGLELSEAQHQTPERVRGPLQPGADWKNLRFEVEEARNHRLSPRELSLRVEPLRGGRLQGAFWRCAVHSERYWLAPEEGLLRLLLGPDEEGHWWRLSELPKAEGPAARPLGELAGDLRALAAQVHLESEGLHLVEHLLLRPLGPGPSAQEAIPADFFSYRLTAVFPGWTARGADRDFRRLASETLALHLPAHLEARCLWPDFHALKDFERRYEAWLEAKRAHSGRQPHQAHDHELERRSESLRSWLWEQSKKAGGV
jgi:hypothetical protein